MGRMPVKAITHLTPPRILLALGWYDYRLHRGVERYARERGWQIAMDVARNRSIPWGWEGDGILAWLGADEELAKFVATACKPTVDFSYRRPHLKFTRVLEDTAEAARMVAEHLLTRGVRNFLFYSDAGNWIYDERGRSFEHELKKSGHNVRWLRWHESKEHCSGPKAWKAKQRWLLKAIRQEEKPLGVFAACDELASDVLEACQLGGIRVPEEVAIVGAGDSLMAVNAMSTPISSVDTNLEMLGYLGARELDRIIRGGQAPSAPIRIPPAGLIVRKSSDLIAVSHRGVARSMRFLWANFHEPIGVEHLAAVAAMSKSAFHRAFITCVGRAPGAEIQRARVEQAKRLLRESREKLSAIATDCGYNSSNSFSIAFKKSTGLTPSDYRTMSAVPARWVAVETSGAPRIIAG
jgi:LacI family transcriptional regulator